MPLGERFLAFYDNNDGSFHDNSDLIAHIITYLFQYYMRGIKISTKRSNLGVRGNHSNLVEDEGMRRRPSVMEVTKHQG